MEAAKDNVIAPLVRTRFALAEHAFRRFNATVPVGTTKEDLENPRFWSFCQEHVRVHDEIRAVAEDSSFFVVLLVAAKAGNLIYPRVVYGTDLGDTDLSAATAAQARYAVKQRGVLGWCLVDVEEDRNIKTGIGKKSDAERELEEYLQALKL